MRIRKHPLTPLAAHPVYGNAGEIPITPRGSLGTTDWTFPLDLHADYTYTAASPAVLTGPTPGTTLTGSSVTFDWTPGTAGATQYYLSVGSTGVGSSNIYNSGWRDVTSWTATGLPTNGETLYVRLSTNFGGTAVHNDYTYTAQ